MATKTKTTTVHRSSVNGRFVTKQYTKTHPKTTEAERVKKSS